MVKSAIPAHYAMASNICGEQDTAWLMLRSTDLMTLLQFIAVGRHRVLAGLISQ